MSRLFFALWPDEATRQALAGMSELLPPGGKPVAAANLHITLVFLGSANEIQQEELIAGAGSIECKPFTLSLYQLVWWRKPRIIQASPAETPEALQQMVASLRQLAADCGIAVDQRHYEAHVTLARKVRLAKDLPQPAPVIWPVDNFCLVRSDTLPEGAQYEVIWRRN
ncbi:MAG TPA: RNA 2',3'-cyclic phosphodiesterase [Gammaproteobacteria bacterium]|nr:RNA 2',3'-cyclic phosphodiesterase [Gammaproteobacteria bacterium]